MLSLDKEWALEDPNTELYQTSIRSFTNEGIRGLTKAEYGEIYRLMSGMSVTKTSVFSEDPNVRTCKSTTVSKTLVIPVIDSLSVTEYETKDGKLVRVNNKPGFYNIIPAEAILSKKTTIFGETIQVTGRSCKIRNEVQTQVEPTRDFLSDVFLFTFNGTIKLTENCRTSNGIVTSDWEFKDEAHIELPISCSIESDQIKCGALKLTSNKVVTVEVGPTRMKKIVKQTVGENKAKITEKVFRGNHTVSNLFGNLPHTTLGISTFYWILIGSVSGGVILLAIIAGICGYRFRSQINAANSPRKSSGGNPLVRNDIQITTEPKFRLGSFKRKKNNISRLEEIPAASLESIPSQTRKFPEQEKLLTMGEQLALEAK